MLDCAACKIWLCHQHTENVYDGSVMILLEKNVFKYYGVYTRSCLVLFVVRVAFMHAFLLSITLCKFINKAMVKCTSVGSTTFLK